PHEAGGVASVEELVEAYEAAGGAPVDRGALRWWQAMGTLRWAVICMIQAQTHVGGLARSVELAAIGRRVCESEHDLLSLLPHLLPHLLPGPTTAAPEPPAPTPSASPASPQPLDWPDASVLVEAVREFLTDDVMASSAGRTRYLA